MMATHIPFSEKSVTVRYGVGLKILPLLNKQNSDCIVLTIFLQASPHLHIYLPHVSILTSEHNITLYNMNISNYYTLLVFIAAISTMAAAIDHDKPRRLRIANIADTNQLKLDGRILQTSTMSMATTESTDNIGVGYNNNMEVVDAIVSKLEEEGETVDPMLAELLVLAAVDEYEESAMHHHDDEYNFTKKCLKLLFIILPEYKAKKLSFICGETVTTSTTPAMTTSTTTAACLPNDDPTCTSNEQCCSNCKYQYSTHTQIVH